MRLNRGGSFAVPRAMPAPRRSIALSALALGVASLLGTAGCRVSVGPADDGNSGGSSGSSGAPAPEPTSTPSSGDASPEVQALFGTLPNATPDTMRGVWGDSVTSNGAVTDLRFRFDKDRIVGGVKCNAQGKEILVGDAVSVAAYDADAKSGSFTLANALAFSTEKDGVKCSGRLDAATWKFAVTDKSVELRPDGLEGYLKLSKLGDSP